LGDEEINFATFSGWMPDCNEQGYDAAVTVSPHISGVDRQLIEQAREIVGDLLVRQSPLAQVGSSV